MKICSSKSWAILAEKLQKTIHLKLKNAKKKKKNFFVWFVFYLILFE